MSNLHEHEASPSSISYRPGNPSNIPQVAVRNAKEAGVLPSGATAPQITLEQSDLSKAKTTYTAQRHAEEVKRRRYRLMDGNAMMMDSWGEGLYDMVILPHFLHVFDEAGMRAVLRKAKKALKPDGRCARRSGCFRGR